MPLWQGALPENVLVSGGVAPPLYEMGENAIAFSPHIAATALCDLSLIPPRTSGNTYLLILGRNEKGKYSKGVSSIFRMDGGIVSGLA